MADLQMCISWGPIAESFHSAISLCQLLPCHLRPPRATLSINLYVTGWLDCTTGAFHMSIPVEPYLLQDEVQVLNAKLRKLLIGPDSDIVLWLDIADLSDHCPIIPLQTLEVWLCQWPSLTGMEHCAPDTRAVTFFRGDWSWNIFYGHSLPSSDSRRSVVSFWRKNVHNTG